MALRHLSLSGATGITSLEPLAGLPLRTLTPDAATGITTLVPLQGFDPSVIRGASPALLATLEG